MPKESLKQCDLAPQTREFYINVLKTLDRANVPYVVGGGYAMACYTGIHRQTKDLDIFILPADRERALKILADAGYRTEYFYPYWIAKAIQGEDFVDIIYNSANGVCVVDDEWFAHAEGTEVLGYRTRLCPAEEQLWSKAFVQDRDRYDGADCVHLILRRGVRFDWQRLLRRFAGHERVLLTHLLLFGYAYPGERGRVPEWVIDRLLEIIRSGPPVNDKVCMGPHIAQRGYLHAIHEWGYADGRLRPYGPLTPQELAQLPP